MTGGSGWSKAYLPSFSVVYGGDDYNGNFDSVFGGKKRAIECVCGCRELKLDPDCSCWRCVDCWAIVGDGEK